MSQGELLARFIIADVDLPTNLRSLHVRLRGDEIVLNLGSLQSEGGHALENIYMDGPPPKFAKSGADAVTLVERWLMQPLKPHHRRTRVIQSVDIAPHLIQPPDWASGGTNQDMLDLMNRYNAKKGA